MTLIRNPKMNPMAGDVLHKWDCNFLVTRVEQGCVYTEPSLSAHKAWIGILFFREWAYGAEVVHGYEEQTEAQEGEARAAYEAVPKPKVEICQDCNSPIIDGNPAGHRVGCESNQDIKW